MTELGILTTAFIGRLTLFFACKYISCVNIPFKVSSPSDYETCTKEQLCIRAEQLWQEWLNDHSLGFLNGVASGDLRTLEHCAKRGTSGVEFRLCFGEVLRFSSLYVQANLHAVLFSLILILICCAFVLSGQDYKALAVAGLVILTLGAVSDPCYWWARQWWTRSRGVSVQAAVETAQSMPNDIN